MPTIIFHNPRCSKSRKALELLNDNNINSLIIEYLKTPIDKKTIKNILKLTKLPVREIIRQQESVYQTNNLDNSSLSEDDLIDAIIKNPILLERPIVIHDNQAKICRPPELVLDLLQG